MLLNFILKIINFQSIDFGSYSCKFRLPEISSSEISSSEISSPEISRRKFRRQKFRRRKLRSIKFAF